MDDKLLKLLAHYKLDAYYGKLIILGIDTLEAFAEITDETLTKLDITNDSADYAKLKNLSELVKSKLDQAEPKPSQTVEDNDEPEHVVSNTNQQPTSGSSGIGKLFVWLIIITLAVVVGIWFSGYNSAKTMVNECSLNLITLSIKVKDMNSIKKSGFMYFVEHKTDYNQRLKDFTSL